MLGVLLTLCVASPVPAQAADHGFLWWEGEAATETTFPAGSWLAGDRLVRPEVLSGRDWLAFSGKRGAEPPRARWRLDVAEAGGYGLWCRKFWKHGPFRWRFDDGAWTRCGRDVPLIDDAPIQKDVTACWVYLGKVELAAGERRFEVELEGAEGRDLVAAFDCFVLSRTRFHPRGALRPGERSGRTSEGWWAFEPEADPFGASAIDLRRLNEARAGAHGFVRRDGARLLLGDGTPVRFWGVDCGLETACQDDEGQRWLARFLARRGVNLVRVHGSFAVEPRLVEVDPRRRERLQAFVEALAGEGIYTQMSFYFPLWFRMGEASGYPGYEGRENRYPFGLLYASEEFRELHFGWMRQLLTEPHPVTGRKLADEPALAIVELCNEDSLLFWTFDRKRVPPRHWFAMETAFGRWAERRYGSFEAAWKAWGGRKVAGDDEERRRMVLADPWNLTAQGFAQGAGEVRHADQLRFLIETQRGTYAAIIARARKELGLRCLLSCSNWHTVDPPRLQPLERWTYTAGDVVDAHGYFGGRHEGRDSSWSVRAGHRYEDRSGLRGPAHLPMFQGQISGWPMQVSELGWPDPNRYKAELPFLAAVLGDHQGIDALCFFALHGDGGW